MSYLLPFYDDFFPFFYDDSCCNTNEESDLDLGIFLVFRKISF